MGRHLSSRPHLGFLCCRWYSQAGSLARQTSETMPILSRFPLPPVRPVGSAEARLSFTKPSSKLSPPQLAHLSSSSSPARLHLIVPDQSRNRIVEIARHRLPLLVIGKPQ